MKLIIIILLFLTNAHSQIITNLEIKNSLVMDAQSASTALVLDAQKRLVSSTVTATELGYLVGATSSIQDQIGTKANDSVVVKLTGDQSISGKKTFTQYEAVSTTLASKPCPVMTTTQRNALTPSTGDCVYNSTSIKSEVYNGSSWIDPNGATVGASYQHDSGQSVVIAGTKLVYNVLLFDSHNAYSSGNYTIPIDGVYKIDASLRNQSAAFAALGSIGIYIEVNSTLVKQNATRVYTAVTTTVTTHVSHTARLSAGDVVAIWGTASTNFNVTVGGGYSEFSITRVGN
jgi:hypothetical protein